MIIFIRRTLRRAVTLLGAWLLTLCCYLQEHGGGEAAVLRAIWVSAGLSCALPALQFSAVCAAVGGRGLCLGTLLTVALTGYVAGRSCLGPLPPPAFLAAAALQALGVALLQPAPPAIAVIHTRSATARRMDKAHSAATLPVRGVTREAWFWLLSGSVAGLGRAVLYLLGEVEVLLLPGEALLVVVAPLLWGVLGRAARWDEPRTLQILSLLLGLGILCQPQLERCCPGEVDDCARAAAVALWHLVLGALPMAAGSVGLCCHGRRLPKPLVGMALVVAAASQVLTRLLPGTSVAAAAAGPLAAAALCARLLHARHPRTGSAWAAGYNALRTVAQISGLQLQGGLQAPPGASINPQTIVSNLRRLLQPGKAAGQDPEFFNNVLLHFWPYVRSFVEDDILKGEVEPVLHREVTGALKFDRCSLGEDPPKVHSMWVIPPTPQSKDIILALDVELSGREEGYERRLHAYAAL